MSPVRLASANSAREYLFARDAAAFITWMINTFGKENVALEIQPSFQEEQIKYNKFLIMLSEAYVLD